MINSHISIGPEFFAKAYLDYSDPSLAIIREFVQNCVDAPGCKTIVIDIDEEQGVLSVSNDGEPMSEDVLFNTFLSLGGTTKGADSVGGFGKAKELLCFCHRSYKIETGSITVLGSGASYGVSRESHYQGTRTTINYDTDKFYDLTSVARWFASKMFWKGDLVINQEHQCTSYNPKSRKSLSIGRVRAEKGGRNIVVRAGGIPMFKSTNDCGYAVVLDLVGDTKTLLTANRDGLRYPHTGTLLDFVRDLSMNKRKAMREDSVTYHDYGSFVYSRQAKETPVKVETVHSTVVDEAAFVAMDHRPEPIEDSTVLPCHEVEAEPEFLFVIRNETGMRPDRSYFPGTMGKRMSRLREEWVKALMTVYEALEIGGNFAIGFVFSEEAEALHEIINGTSVYYINPVSIERTASGVRTMRSKKLDRHDLLAYATHEVIHGLGYRYHDERFSSALTEAMAKVIRYKR